MYAAQKSGNPRITRVVLSGSSNIASTLRSGPSVGSSCPTQVPLSAHVSEGECGFTASRISLGLGHALRPPLAETVPWTTEYIKVSAPMLGPL